MPLWREELSGPKDAADAVARVDCTVQLWRRWLEAGTFPDHPWRWTLQRSALVLKGLTYEPTGAMVAALTTSLPETPGGERNWDYRYTWIRDATFTLWSLHVIGFDQEAREFMEFVVRALPRPGPRDPDHVRDRRRDRAHREDAGPPLRLRRLAPRADRQRRL